MNNRLLQIINRLQLSPKDKNDLVNIIQNNNTNGNSQPSVVNIKRSDLLTNNAKALELAKIFVDSYIGYNKEIDDWEIDYEKIPHINLIIDFSVLLLDDDMVSGFEKVIIESIAHNILLTSNATMKIIGLNLKGYSHLQERMFMITWGIPFIMANKDIITEGDGKISAEWNWI